VTTAVTILIADESPALRELAREVLISTAMTSPTRRPAARRSSWLTACSPQ
jgi:hypothetical protein